ncbi:MAG TPA: 30S ribosomal protein S17 [Phycisphaerae bacterium]|nr:30S ribosomal protein S17 [Phycisphaerae bacterium]
MSDEHNEQQGAPPGRKARRARIGTVNSISGDKTIRVVVDNLVKHAMYGKYVRRRMKLAVHDPNRAAKLNDLVEIVPCRRMSKSKAWRLVRVVRRGDAAPAAGEREG